MIRRVAPAAALVLLAHAAAAQQPAARQPATQTEQRQKADTATHAAAVQRGIDLLESGEPDSALKVLRPYAASNPRDYEAALRLGQAYAGTGDIKAAVAEMERAVEMHPTPRYWMELAGAYGARAGGGFAGWRPFRTRQARRALRRAVAADSTSVEARMALFQFDAFTPPLYGGNRRRAREQMQAIQRRSEYYGGLSQALFHASAAQHTAAERQLKTMVSTYPDSAAAYGMLTGLYRERKRWGDALDLLDRLRRERPDLRTVLFDIGLTARLAGETEHYDRGVRALRQYLSYTPEWNEPPHAAARFELGKIFEKQGRKDMARAEYNESLRLDPDFPQAKAALRILDRQAQTTAAKSKQ